MPSTLQQLCDMSSLLLTPEDRSDIPILNRSIELMEIESKRMSERINVTRELQAKALHFLASNGIETEHISTPINTEHVFQLVQVDDNTEITKFLSDQQEFILIESIEGQRAKNDMDFEDFFERQMGSIIEEARKERIENDGNASDLKEFEKYNNISGPSRITEYAEVIAEMNKSRLNGSSFDILDKLSNIRNVSDLKKSQNSAFEAWNMLSHLVNSPEFDGKSLGRFTRSCVTEPYQSLQAVSARRALMSTSKSWLERQFSQLINEALNRNARRMRIGGDPSLVHRLRAFIDLTFKTTTGWTDDRLEVIDGLPIWTFIYLLIRSGHIKDAAKFMDNHREMFTSDHKFMDYFQEYVNAELYCVSKPTQEAILADYYKLEYGEVTNDPYKLLLYKIIGRCELHKKSIPDIIKTYEDYTWLQLTMVREVTDTEEFVFERYRLVDLQKHITTCGDTWFDQGENDPWTYFKILLLTLQFEEAIDHLYKQKHLRLETVHLAIAMAYFGLLKIPTPKQAYTSQMLVKESEDRYLLNFARLIYQYVQVYVSGKPKEALQYLSLLTLYSPKYGYPSDDMVSLARSFVCQFAATSKDFKALIGSMDNELTPGLIDDQKEPFDLFTQDDLTKYILYPIAEERIANGYCRDAIYIYSYSRDYNKALDVLAKEISDTLNRSQSSRALDSSYSGPINEDVISFASQTMEYYTKYQTISKMIDERKKSTVIILMQLLQFHHFYKSNKYEEAMRYLNKTGLVCLSNKFEEIDLAATRFQQLDPIIQQVIPSILLNTMDIIYKEHTRNVDNSRKSRSLMTFTGLINCFVPHDLLVSLNRADTLISSKVAFD